MAEPELTIVIPCYNEAANIPCVLPQILAHCEAMNYLLIVVNDGSRDGSRELLERYHSPRCKILNHKCNRGYGGALKTGLAAARTRWAITIDSDGQHRLEDVDRLFAAARESDSDLVVGARPQSSSGFYRSSGKTLIRLFTALLLKLPVSDLNSGMKLYLMPVARPYLALCPNCMAFSDVVLLLMVNDNKLVTEVPITVEARLGGSSTIGVHTAVETLVEIVNITMLLKPLKLFSMLGALFCLTGFGWGVTTYCFSRTITPIGSMMFLCGIIFFVLGLLAEQLAEMRRSQAGIDQPQPGE